MIAIPIAIIAGYLIGHFLVVIGTIIYLEWQCYKQRRNLNKPNIPSFDCDRQILNDSVKTK